MLYIFRNERKQGRKKETTKEGKDKDRKTDTQSKKAEETIDVWINLIFVFLSKRILFTSKIIIKKSAKVGESHIEQHEGRRRGAKFSGKRRK